MSEPARVAGLGDHGARASRTTSTHATPELSAYTAPVGLTWGGGLGADDDTVLGWQEEALCAQTDPEAFFPEKGGSTREAKRICVGCEVKSECLEYALGHDERFGIWGGLSERERRRLKRLAV